MVHIYHRLGIIRRGGDDNCFGSTLQVGPGLLYSSEYAGRLHRVFFTSVTSCVIDGISVLEHGDGLPCDDRFLLIVSHDHAVELAVVGIIQEHLNHVVEVNEWSLINGSLTS